MLQPTAAYTRFHLCRAARHLAAALSVIIVAAVCPLPTSAAPAITSPRVVAAPAAAPAGLRVVGSAGVKAPATVPTGYLVTPAGYFHPACAYHVRDGWARPTGAAHVARHVLPADALPACPYPHYTPDGTRVAPLSARRAPRTASVAAPPAPPPPTPPGYTGWVESASAYLPVTQAISYLRARWLVPSPPPHPTTAVNYFFPGAETTGNQTPTHTTIIQPVLGWNSWGPASTWSIASWNCCVDGNVQYGDYALVQSGDIIEGEMTGQDCNTVTAVCKRWLILTRDLTSGAEVSLLADVYGQAFNRIFAAVLEVYYVAACDDLGADGNSVFIDVEARDMAGHALSLDYEPEYFDSDFGYAGDPHKPPFNCGARIDTLIPGWAYQLVWGPVNYQADAVSARRASDGSTAGR